MRVVVGKENHQKVEKVLVCSPGVTPPEKGGWYFYTSVKKGIQNIFFKSIGEGVGAGYAQVLTVADAEGRMITLSDATVWRGSQRAHPCEGGYIVTPEPLPIDPDDFARWMDESRKLGYQYVESPVDAEYFFRMDRGDVGHLNHIWGSPWSLDASATSEAYQFATMWPSEYICCSVLPEHGRWTYRTGTGSHLRVWGAVNDRDHAVFLAETILRRDWLTRHEKVVAQCGGRTDWTGGCPVPLPCEILTTTISRQLKGEGQWTATE